MRARPLSQFIEDETFPAKGWKDTICNIIGVYNQPFDLDSVEQTFEFPEVTLGENWELYATSEIDGKKFYSILETPEDGDYVMLPVPRTISDFIEDCDRIWKKDLVFDGNLVKRNYRFV